MNSLWRSADSIASRDLDARRQHRWAVWVACFAVMVVRTSMLIHRSYFDGRLSGPPPYDDISYFYDAMWRLRTTDLDGLGASIRLLIAYPPHAPWSTAAAMLGFALSNNQLYAPYLVNAVAVWALLTAAVTILSLPPVLAVGVFIVASLTPVVDWSVMTFQPDLIMGLLVAVTCARLIADDQRKPGWRRAILLGALGAAALLTKPTAFPPIIALLGFACMLLVGREFILPSSNEPMVHRLMARLRFVGVTLLVAALGFSIYAIPAWRDLTAYIYTVMWGKRELLAPNHLNLQDYLLFYPRFENMMMGQAGAAMSVIAVAALLSVLVARRRGDLFVLLGTAAFVLSTFAILLSAPAQAIFFGSILYCGSLVLLVVGVSMMLVVLLDRGRPRIAAGLLAILLVYSISTYADAQPKADPVAQQESSLILREVDDAIAQHQLKRGLQPGGRQMTYLLVVYPHPTPDGAYMLRAMQRRYQEQSLGDGLWISTDLEYWKGLASKADYIIVPDERIVAAYPLALPITKMMPTIRSFLQTSPLYHILKDVDTPGGHVLVYIRAVP